MLRDVVPNQIYDAIKKSGSEGDINEIRIRVNKPICVVCNTRTYFLSDDGLCSSYGQAIFGSEEIIEDIIFRASDYSLYSVNEQIKNGFIMINGGIRIGLCGEVVLSDEIKTIKNFTSICIRIPHQIKNCSLPIFNQILNEGSLNNTLIISPPGAGKTTMLRDIIYQFSYHNYPFNIFIADERGELTGGGKFDLGYFYDSICFLNKNDSMMLGLRSMSPDIVVTDELGSIKDIEAVQKLVNSGVCVIASIHAKDIDELRQKKELQNLLESKVFKRYVVLSKKTGVGTIEGLYRENFTKIYGGAI